MDIAFSTSSWGGFIVPPPYRRLASRESGDTPPPYRELIEPGSESLRRETALFRNFAEVKPSPDGIRAFLKEHPDLGAEPQALFHDKSGGAVFVFPYDYKGEGADDRAVLEVLILGRCVRLWDQVQRNDRRILGRYIRRVRDTKSSLLFVYDSHPGLPRTQAAPPPDIRETSKIILSDIDTDQFLLANQGDLRPAARAYLMGVINNKLDGTINGQLIEGPGKHGRMELHFAPKTLLAALWLQFAEAIDGKVEYSRCLICEHWFRRGAHYDRVYCADKCNVAASRIRKKARDLIAGGMTVERAAKVLKTEPKLLEELLSPRPTKGMTHGTQAKRTR